MPRQATPYTDPRYQVQIEDLPESKYKVESITDLSPEVQVEPHESHPISAAGLMAFSPAHDTTAGVARLLGAANVLSSQVNAGAMDLGGRAAQKVGLPEAIGRSVADAFVPGSELGGVVGKKMRDWGIKQKRDIELGRHVTQDAPTGARITGQTLGGFLTLPSMFLVQQAGAGVAGKAIQGASKIPGVTSLASRVPGLGSAAGRQAATNIFGIMTGWGFVGATQAGPEESPAAGFVRTAPLGALAEVTGLPNAFWKRYLLDIGTFGTLNAVSGGGLEYAIADSLLSFFTAGPSHITKPRRTIFHPSRWTSKAKSGVSEFDPRSTPEQRAAIRESMNAVKQRLAGDYRALQGKQRILNHIYEGYTIEKTAEATGVSQDMVRHILREQGWPANEAAQQQMIEANPEGPPKAKIFQALSATKMFKKSNTGKSFEWRAPGVSSDQIKSARRNVRHYVDKNGNLVLLPTNVTAEVIGNNVLQRPLSERKPWQMTTLEFMEKNNISEPREGMVAHRRAVVDALQSGEDVPRPVANSLGIKQEDLATSTIKAPEADSPGIKQKDTADITDPREAARLTSQRFQNWAYMQGADPEGLVRVAEALSLRGELDSFELRSLELRLQEMFRLRSDNAKEIFDNAKRDGEPISMDRAAEIAESNRAFNARVTQAFERIRALAAEKVPEAEKAPEPEAEPNTRPMTEEEGTALLKSVMEYLDSIYSGLADSPSERVREIIVLRNYLKGTDFAPEQRANLQRHLSELEDLYREEDVVRLQEAMDTLERIKEGEGPEVLAPQPKKKPAVEQQQAKPPATENGSIEAETAKSGKKMWVARLGWREARFPATQDGLERAQTWLDNEAGKIKIEDEAPAKPQPEPKATKPAKQGKIYDVAPDKLVKLRFRTEEGVPSKEAWSEGQAMHLLKSLNLLRPIEDIPTGPDPGLKAPEDIMRLSEALGKLSAEDMGVLVKHIQSGNRVFSDEPWVGKLTGDEVSLVRGMLEGEPHFLASSLGDFNEPGQRAELMRRLAEIKPDNSGQQVSTLEALVGFLHEHYGVQDTKSLLFLLRDLYGPKFLQENGRNALVAFSDVMAKANKLVDPETPAGSDILRQYSEEMQGMQERLYGIFQQYEQALAEAVPSAKQPASATPEEVTRMTALLKPLVDRISPKLNERLEAARDKGEGRPTEAIRELLEIQNDLYMKIMDLAPTGNIEPSKEYIEQIRRDVEAPTDKNTRSGGYRYSRRAAQRVHDMLKTDYSNTTVDDADTVMLQVLSDAEHLSIAGYPTISSLAKILGDVALLSQRMNARTTKRPAHKDVTKLINRYGLRKLLMEKLSKEDRAAAREIAAAMLEAPPRVRQMFFNELSESSEALTQDDPNARMQRAILDLKSRSLASAIRTAREKGTAQSITVFGRERQSRTERRQYRNSLVNSVINSTIDVSRALYRIEEQTGLPFGRIADAAAMADKLRAIMQEDIMRSIWANTKYEGFRGKVNLMSPAEQKHIFRALIDADYETPHPDQREIANRMRAWYDMMLPIVREQKFMHWARGKKDQDLPVDVSVEKLETLGLRGEEEVNLARSAMRSKLTRVLKLKQKGTLLPDGQEAWRVELDAPLKWTDTSGREHTMEWGGKQDFHVQFSKDVIKSKSNMDSIFQRAESTTGHAKPAERKVPTFDPDRNLMVDFRKYVFDMLTWKDMQPVIDDMRDLAKYGADLGIYHTGGLERYQRTLLGVSSSEFGLTTLGRISVSIPKLSILLRNILKWSGFQLFQSPALGFARAADISSPAFWKNALKLAPGARRLSPTRNLDLSNTPEAKEYYRTYVQQIEGVIHETSNIRSSALIEKPALQHFDRFLRIAASAPSRAFAHMDGMPRSAAYAYATDATRSAIAQYKEKPTYKNLMHVLNVSGFQYYRPTEQLPFLQMMRDNPDAAAMYAGRKFSNSVNFSYDIPDRGIFFQNTAVSSVMFPYSTYPRGVGQDVLYDGVRPFVSSLAKIADGTASKHDVYRARKTGSRLALWYLSQLAIDNIIQEGLGIDYTVYGIQTLAYEPSILVYGMAQDFGEAMRSEDNKKAAMFDALLENGLPGYSIVLRFKEGKEAVAHMTHTKSGRTFKIPMREGIVEMLTNRYAMSKDPKYAQVVNRGEDYLAPNHKAYRNANFFEFMQFMLFGTHNASYRKDAAEAMVDTAIAQQKYGADSWQAKRHQKRLDDLLWRYPRRQPQGLLPPEYQTTPPAVRKEATEEYISREMLPEDRYTFWDELLGREGK